MDDQPPQPGTGPEPASPAMRILASAPDALSYDPVVRQSVRALLLAAVPRRPAEHARR